MILNAASSLYKNCIPPVVVDCDNNGVVSHGNTSLWSLLTNQPQADVLRMFKHLVLIQPFPVKLKYVQSHADKTKKWQDCTLKEQINIKVDRLAKKGFVSGTLHWALYRRHLSVQTNLGHNGRKESNGDPFFGIGGILGPFNC